MKIKEIREFIDQYRTFCISDYKIRGILFSDYKLIDSKWSGQHKYKNEETYYRSPDQEDSVTFSGCISVIFGVRGSDVICTMHVYDGDSCYGHRLGQRCEFTFLINKSNNMIDKAIEYKMDVIAERIIEKEDEEIYKKRIAGAIKCIKSKLNGEDK